MRVSVVIDNHNYEQFLPDAIDSALAQTWADTEVLVIDDGSTDGSRAVIEFYGNRVTPIYQDNAGQGSAISAAVPKATGDAVIFLDADDTLEPDIVERVANAFDNEPNLARVQWPLQTIDLDGHARGPVVPNPSMMRSGDLRNHVLRYRTHVWPAMSGNAYKADVLRQLMPVPHEFRLGCDLYLAETTPLFGNVRSLADVGGGYRVHQTNNWTRKDLDPEYIRQKIRWTLASHESVRKTCTNLGIPCPDDARDALDVAFLAQRLASLRLDATNHLVPTDRRGALTRRGMWAAIRHPHHSAKHKVKRVGWFLGVGFGSDRIARKLIRRFYFRPTA